MIEETAKVIEVAEKSVKVQAQPSSACGACHARSACGQGLLSKYFNQSPGQLTLDKKLSNGEPLNVLEGEELILGIDEGSVLVGAFYAYFIPLFSVIFFATLTYFVSIESELLQLVIIFLGVVLSLVFSNAYLDRGARHLDKVLPVILRKSNASKRIPIVERME